MHEISDEYDELECNEYANVMEYLENDKCEYDICNLHVFFATYWINNALECLDYINMNRWMR